MRHLPRFLRVSRRPEDSADQRLGLFVTLVGGTIVALLVIWFVTTVRF